MADCCFVSDCLFCGIAAGSVPAQVVRESADVVVFADVRPQAPFHVLSIPRRHLADAADLALDPPLFAAVMAEGIAAAVSAGCDDGYRIVFNTGAWGGQTVKHVHAHVLGGRQLQWPPG